MSSKIIVLFLAVVLVAGAVVFLVLKGSPEEEKTLVAGRAMVAEIDWNGSFFGLLSEEGGQYRPLNLADDFQRDGLVVLFSGYVFEQTDPRSWGVPFEIIEIREDINW